MTTNIRPNVVPLLVLVAVSVYTVYVIFSEPLYIDGEAYERTMDYHLYAGFGLLALVLGLYVSENKLFKYGVLALSILWLIGIVNFFPFSWGLSLGLNMQIGALLFMGIYYLLNRTRANH